MNKESNEDSASSFSPAFSSSCFEHKLFISLCFEGYQFSKINRCNAIVSAKKTLVNQRKMSKEQRKTDDGSKCEVLIIPAKMKKSLYAVPRTKNENRFDKGREILGRAIYTNKDHHAILAETILICADVLYNSEHSPALSGAHCC